MRRPTCFSRGALLAGLVVTAAAAPAARAGGTLEPRLVRDINPGDASGFDSLSQFSKPLGGVVYFRANDGQTGIEVWRTDGTTGGTQLLNDLRPGGTGSFPTNITTAGGNVYFHASTSVPTGSKVFISDGTSAGTRLLVDTWPAANIGFFGPPAPSNFTAYGSQVLFTASSENQGQELWTTDGTTAGTSLVKDVHPGQQGSVPVGLTPFAGKVYYAADDKFTPSAPGSPTGFFDRELFVTDNTAAGTVRVKDINPGPQPSIPIDFRVMGNQLLFRANDGTHGTELWTSDGTEAGTQLLKDINPAGASNPMHPAVAGNRMFFNANNGAAGAELWLTDGTADGTRLVKDINPAGPSQPLNLTAVGQRVFFSADDGAHGIELWTSDGTEAGTRLVKDINPGTERASPLELTALGDLLFFVAINPEDVGSRVKTQLWMTDGTEAGTLMVFEEPGTSTGYSIGDLTVLGSELLFTAPAGVDGNGFSINTELFAVTVPEPAAMTALLGVGALALRRTRRRQA
jgi:MYXO-CTERM domain-containing protein